MSGANKHNLVNSKRSISLTGLAIIEYFKAFLKSSISWTGIEVMEDDLAKICRTDHRTPWRVLAGK
jgi:hypothetical protein